MNLRHLKSQLIVDEGISLKTYRDSLGKLTVGIGHLVLLQDKLRVGDTITKRRCDKLFLEDIGIATRSCKKVFCNFYELPDDVQEIIANMIFNLGEKNFRGFVNLIDAINKWDWKDAAGHMKSSLWFKQVGLRARRLCERMMKVVC